MATTAPLRAPGLLYGLGAAAAAAALLLHLAALTVLSGRGADVATTGAWTLAGLVGTAAAAAASRRVGDARRSRAVRLVAAAAAVWTAGALVRGVAALSGVAGLTAAAEVLWCGFAATMILALVARAPRHALSLRLFALDAIPVGLAAVQLARVATETGLHEPVSDQVFVTSYAALFLIVLVVNAQVALLERERDIAFWSFIAANALAGAAAFAWLLESTESRVAGGNALDAIWSGALLLLGAAAVLRSRSPAVAAPAEQATDAGFRAVPPAAALVTLIALLEFADRSRYPLAFWFALVSFLAFAARTYLARRDTRELFLRESEARAAAERADRRKDDFLALVSHELRTPLTSIRGYLELVLDEPDELSEEQLRFLRTVERNNERLLRLVSDLLFAAQVEQGTVPLSDERIGLDRLAEECVDAAAVAARAAGVELVLRAGSRAEVWGDRARLGQVLDNLVSNGVKFTPAGGTVEVRTLRDGDTAVLEVRDTGPGIPVEEQAQLFERFFRTRAATERAIQGTGLGLSIARSIVTAHGGELELESSEGAGAVFRVLLPLAA